MCSSDLYIYRDEYLVNWSVPLATAISDLEVEHKDVDDVLYEVAYEVEGGGEIVIATVRPVTILADVAIAVHPDDPRYAELVGREAIVPMVGRRIPVNVSSSTLPRSRNHGPHRQTRPCLPAAAGPATLRPGAQRPRGTSERPGGRRRPEHPGE